MRSSRRARRCTRSIRVPQRGSRAGRRPGSGTAARWASGRLGEDALAATVGYPRNCGELPDLCPSAEGEPPCATPWSPLPRLARDAARCPILVGTREGLRRVSLVSAAYVRDGGGQRESDPKGHRAVRDRAPSGASRRRRFTLIKRHPVGDMMGVESVPRTHPRFQLTGMR